MFSGDDVYKKVKVLSGGERGRLALCKLLLQPSNLLVLDEPTNHLDIDSRAALVEAINAFEGAVILVSHDRHLIEATADRLWLVADGRVRPFDGDVEDYRRLLLETSAEPREHEPAAAPQDTGGRRGAAERRSRLAPLRQRAREAERELEKLHARRQAIEEELAGERIYRDGALVAARRRELAELAERIAAAEARWLEAETEIEALQSGA